MCARAMCNGLVLFIGNKKYDWKYEREENSASPVDGIFRESMFIHAYFFSFQASVASKSHDIRDEMRWKYYCLFCYPRRVNESRKKYAAQLPAAWNMETTLSRVVVVVFAFDIIFILRNCSTNKNHSHSHNCQSNRTHTCTSFIFDRRHTCVRVTVRSTASISHSYIKQQRPKEYITDNVYREADTCTLLVHRRHSLNLYLNRSMWMWIEKFWRVEMWSRQWVRQPINNSDSFWSCVVLCCWYNYVTDMCLEKGQMHFMKHEFVSDRCRFAVSGKILRFSHANWLNRLTVDFSENGLENFVASRHQSSGSHLFVSLISDFSFLRTISTISSFRESGCTELLIGRAVLRSSRDPDGQCWASPSSLFTTKKTARPVCVSENGLTQVHAHWCLASQW